MTQTATSTEQPVPDQQRIRPVWQIVLMAFVVLRVLTLGIGLYVAQLSEPLNDSVWLYWDSVWYLRIALWGYESIDGTLASTGWLPVYPLMVRAVMAFGFSPVVAGIIVSNVSLVLGLWALYQLVLHLTQDQANAQRTIWNVVLFPTAVFLVAAYTESTFLLLTVLVTLAGIRRRWILAGLLAAVASATRLQGVMVSVLLAGLWLNQYGWTVTKPFSADNWHKVLVALREEPRGLIGVLLAPCGLFLYMGYLWVEFGDPLLFLSVHQGIETTFGALGPLDTLWRTIRFVIEQTPNSFLEIVGLTLLVWIIATLFPVGKQLGEAYVLYIVAQLLLITWGGPISSLPRFTVTMFPLFIILGQAPISRWRIALYSILLCFFTFLFTSGLYAG